MLDVQRYITPVKSFLMINVRSKINYDGKQLNFR